MPQGIHDNDSNNQTHLVSRHITRPFKQPLERAHLLPISKISSIRNEISIVMQKQGPSGNKGASTIPKRSRSQQKKRSYTQSLLEDFGAEIHSHLCKLEKEVNQDSFLEKHNITEEYRGKMVDWMAEVLHTFKCSDQTFFLAVNIMDRYFAKVERKLEAGELHLTGIVSMFIASKYEDVVPLLMKTILNKIGHNKFPLEVIQNKELEILKVLGYRIGCPTVKESLDRLFEEIKELYVASEELKSLSMYIAKLASHDYSLMQYKNSVLAISVLRLALKIQDQKHKVQEYKVVMKNVLEFFGMEAQAIKESSDNLLSLIQNFEKKHKNFKNVSKQYEQTLKSFAQFQ